MIKKRAMKKIIYIFINHLSILACINCGSHQALQQSSLKNITPDYVPDQIAAIQRELSIMAEQGMENTENYRDLEEQLEAAHEAYKKFSEIAYKEHWLKPRSKSNAYINDTPTEPYSSDDTLILEEVNREEGEKGLIQRLLSIFKW